MVLPVFFILPVFGCGAPETSRPEQELQEEQHKAQQKVDADEREMRKTQKR